MFKRVLFAGIFLGIVVCARAADDTNSPPVTFADKKLEKAVRYFVLEKRETDKPLTEADLYHLSTIKATGLAITNLQGLEKCVSLASLDLATNNIKDLSPIAKLSRIQYLNLAFNRIEDLSPLSEIYALQYIELTKNRVKSIAPLSKLTNMAALYLNGNEISDIGAVAGMRRLSSLYLDNNKVKSLEPLRNITGLSSLSLNNNQVSDLEPLIKMDRLYFLFLENNKIKELGNWPALEGRATNEFLPFLNLYIKGNPLSRISKKKLDYLKDLGTRIQSR